MRLTFSIKQLPKGQGGGVGAGLGSSNSVKHFTYLHINWLKRKYIQGNQAQSHPYRCTHIHTYVCMYVLLVHVCQRSKGRKGPFASPHFRSGLSLSLSATLHTMTVSLSHSLYPSLCLFASFLHSLFFGHFWHFKCVWLFPFDQRIVNWFTDWVQVQLMRQQQRSTELQQWKGHVALTKDLQADRHSSNCFVDLQQRNATNLSFPDNKIIQM